MCNCITEVTKTGFEHLQQKHRKDKLDNPRLLHVSYHFGNVSYMSTYNELQYECTPRKSDGTMGKTIKKTLSMMHSFCPFCGEKYIKEEEMKEVPEP